MKVLVGTPGNKQDNRTDLRSMVTVLNVAFPFSLKRVISRLRRRPGLLSLPDSDEPSKEWQIILMEVYDAGLVPIDPKLQTIEELNCVEKIS